MTGLSTLIQPDMEAASRDAKMKSIPEYEVVKNITKGSELTEYMVMLFFPEAYQKLFKIDTVLQRNTLPPCDFGALRCRERRGTALFARQIGRLTNRAPP
jgi:hypothetical protein